MFYQLFSGLVGECEAQANASLKKQIRGWLRLAKDQVRFEEPAWPLAMGGCYVVDSIFGGVRTQILKGFLALRHELLERG